MNADQRIAVAILGLFAFLCSITLCVYDSFHLPEPPPSLNQVGEDYWCAKMNEDAMYKLRHLKSGDTVTFYCNTFFDVKPGRIEVIQ